MEINKDKIEQFESEHAGRFFIKLGDLKRERTDKFTACLPPMATRRNRGPRWTPGREPSSKPDPKAVSSFRGLAKIQKFIQRAAL